MATAGVSPSTLTGFQASQANPSTDQNYVLSATQLPIETVSQFTIVAPTGFQVSAQKAGPYQDNIVVGSDADDQDGVNDFANLQKSIFVRLKSGLTPGNFSGDVLNINSLVGTRKVAVSGQAFANVPPVLSSGTTVLPALSTTQGVASAEKNYLLVLKNGADFAGTNTSVVAPTGFEVSKTTGGPFSDNLTIAFTDWKLESNGDRTHPIFVRIKASAVQGTLSGSITNAFGQLSNFSVAVSGTVASPPATSVNPGSLAFTTSVGTPSAPQAFTLSGTNLPIATPPIIGVTVQAPAGYEVATSASGPFSNQLQTLTGVAADATASRELFVRLKGTTAGAVNGTLTAQLGSITPSNLSLNGTVTADSTDLTPIVDLPQANFTASGSNATRNFTVKLSEVGGRATSSGNVVFRITAPLGYSLSFDPALGSIAVSGGGTVSVDNAKWNLTATSLSGLQITMTIKAGQLISAHGTTTLGFSLSRTLANSGSTSNLTVSVEDDPSKQFDANPANNIYVRILNAL